MNEGLTYAFKGSFAFDTSAVKTCALQRQRAVIVTVSCWEVMVSFALSVLGNRVRNER